MDDLPEDVLDIICDNMESWSDLVFVGVACKRFFRPAMKAVWPHVNSQQLAVLLEAQHPDPIVPITYTPELGAAFVSRLQNLYGIYVRSLTIYHTTQSFFVYQCIVAGGGLSQMMPDVKRVEIRCEERTPFFETLDLLELTIPACLSRLALRVIPIPFVSEGDARASTRFPETQTAVQARNNMQKWMGALSRNVDSLRELEIIVGDGFVADDDLYRGLRFPPRNHWKVPYHFEPPLTRHLPLFHDLISLKLSFRHRGRHIVSAVASLPQLRYLDLSLVDMNSLSDIGYGPSSFPNLRRLTIQPFVSVPKSGRNIIYLFQPFIPHIPQRAPNLTCLFESISSVHLSSIDIPFDSLEGLREILLLLRRWISTLRTVQLYCVPNMSEWVTSDELFPALLPLTDFPSLESVVFDWGRRPFGLRDFTDDQYDTLVSSWPQLTTFIMKANCFWPVEPPPRATHQTLWLFATKCHHLKTLIVPVHLASDTEKSRLDPADPESPLTGFYSPTCAYIQDENFEQARHPHLRYLFPHLRFELRARLKELAGSTREYSNDTEFS